MARKMGKPGKNNSADFQKQIENLKKFSDKLSAVKKVQLDDNNNFNFFRAVGMSNQEIKHSAFLKFLMDPNRPHGLNNKFLKDLLEKLYDYNTSCIIKKPKDFKENKNILKENGFDTKDKLLRLADEKSEDVVVVTEENNIDILIKFLNKKTIIAIENKYDSDTHDEQLLRYEKLLDDDYGDFTNKICIFLRKNTESLPRNEDKGYNNRWCLFDYNEICKIIKDIKKSKRGKIKYILEDYMDIFEYNTKKNEICRSILKDYKNQFQIVKDYELNSRVAYDYCWEWVDDVATKKALQIKEIKRNENSTDFYTENLKKFFDNYGENIAERTWLARYRYGSGDGIQFWILIKKSPSKNWSPAQIEIIQKLCGVQVPDNGKSEYGYNDIKNRTILGKDELGDEVSDELKVEIKSHLEGDKNIVGFKNVIIDFENKLENILNERL